MRHGTHRSYCINRCRCDLCKQAHARYEKERQLDKLAGRDRLVDSIGTARRLMALQAIGWTQAQLAESLTEIGHQQRICQLLARQRVRRDTAEGIAAFYEKASMMPRVGPNSDRARTLARRKGWPPPLAWDCIDTDPKPHGDYPGALLMCANGHRRDVYAIPRPEKNSFRCLRCEEIRRDRAAA